MPNSGSAQFRNIVAANAPWKTAQELIAAIKPAAGAWTFEEFTQALRTGRPVVLFDDHDREGEADLIVAASRLTVPEMARLIRDGSGIVCLCLPGATIDRLQLPPMAKTNASRYGTAFTVSIEARTGVSTGVSAADRITTISFGKERPVDPGNSDEAHAKNRRANFVITSK